MLAGLTLATWGAGWMLAGLMLANWGARWMLAGLMPANWGAGRMAHREAGWMLAGLMPANWGAGWESGVFKKSLSQPGNELLNQGLWETSLRALRRHPSLDSHPKSLVNCP
ncbi:Hypothetical protein SMAX5B_021099 [Scophthalmus maximus]|uniref:Uncharacterized protein n=1 Tax=Scophthalmus maximus TaxID=52904 RepID=A0A2U9CDC8_SCOMX|nr:Hypothetical protein SMAX5B_021099 [Scophthalmus maximus]